MGSSNPERRTLKSDELLLYHSGENFAYSGIGFYFKGVSHIKLKLPGIEPGEPEDRTRDVAPLI